MTDRNKNTEMQALTDHLDPLSAQKIEEQTPAEKSLATSNFRQQLWAHIKKPAFWKRTIPTILFSWLVPWLTFQVVQAHFSETLALFITAIVPALWSLFNIIRHHRLDWLAVLTIVGILLSVVPTLLLQDPRLLLLKDGFSMLVMACFFLLLAVLPSRTWVAVMSGLLHSSGSGEGAQSSAVLQALPQSKTWLGIRIANLIVGLVFIGEFVLRAILLYKLPTAQFLLLAPIIARSFTFLIIGAIPLAIFFRMAMRRKRR